MSQPDSKDIRDLEAVDCTDYTGKGQVVESLVAEVGDRGGCLDSKVAVNFEAAVEVVRGHYFVAAVDCTHSPEQEGIR